VAKIKSVKNFSKKEVIIRRAAELFSSHGFVAASMRNLAEALGVEAPSLYNHIGSKSQLLQEICFKVAADFTDHIDAVEQMTELGAVQKIERILRFHVNHTLAHFYEVFVANHEWKHLPGPLLDDFLQQRRNYEKKWATIVEAGIKKKEIKKLNAYSVVLTCLSALRGLEFWHRHKKNVSAKELEDDMVALLLHGIVKNPAQ
jgi:TetR/AcrR family transcriptional regulator, cholesterol catabolism regulator